MPRDPVTLDQARIFLAVVDAGSFSAAGRRLRRAQSAISFVIATMETMLSLPLFERSPRGLTITAAGLALVAQARAMVGSADEFHARARDLAAGLESEVLLAVDVLFPLSRVVAAMKQFEVEFPRVPTRLFVEALGGVAKLVNDRACGLGVIGSSPDLPADMVSEPLGTVDMIAVAAPGHLLAAIAGALPAAVLREHLQLVVTDRSGLTVGQEFNVYGARTWRIGDLGAKHALLLEGVGWGIMPNYLVATDIAADRLRPLALEAWGGSPLRLPFHLIRHGRGALGPAGRRLSEILRQVKPTTSALAAETG